MRPSRRLDDGARALVFGLALSAPLWAIGYLAAAVILKATG